MSFSYLKSPGTVERTAERRHRQLISEPKRRRIGPGLIVLGFVVIVVAALAVGGVMLVSAKASLTTDPTALAKIGMPLGGGKIESVRVSGPHGRRIPVYWRGQQLWPKRLIPAHQRVSITVVIKRPGWVAWLAGKTQTLHLVFRAPSASLRSHYLTLRAKDPLRLNFKQPISKIAFGEPGHLIRHTLATPREEITLSRPAPAGTATVEAALRTWEKAKPAVVSWFPAGASASAVASPAPGSQIKPNQPITLTFSKTVQQALGSSRPPVNPRTEGTWETLNSHAIKFVPTGYGYGLNTPVTIGLPNDVHLVGGSQSSNATSGGWTVPAGSITRLQQLLAMLGYMPVKFKYSGGGVDLTPAAQEAAAVKPPDGKFSMRYSNTPSAVRSSWKPGASGVITQGALMAFENNHAMTADGTAGPLVWRALIGDVIAGHKSTFGYTYVMVTKGSPEELNLWHNGHTVLTTPVNTGIPGRETVDGTFPVFEHLTSTTMSGTNPDGSHYSDPGVPWVSYFNGGDALHGFPRGSYGSPQSLGCVEMPISTAGQVFPYTPIGTLVDVS